MKDFFKLLIQVVLKIIAFALSTICHTILFLYKALSFLRSKVVNLFKKEKKNG